MAEFNNELLEKARAAKSPEEIIALAKENDVLLSEEEANAYFEQMNKTGELSDDELDSVAGGGCHSGDGRLVVTSLYSCKDFSCVCGAGNSVVLRGATQNMHYVCTSCSRARGCDTCKYCSYENGLWLCSNPANNK